MVTFVIETKDRKDVLGYCKTLREAKNTILESGLLKENAVILKLQGQYFGEGFHKYRLWLENNKWIYERY